MFERKTGNISVLLQSLTNRHFVNLFVYVLAFNTLSIPAIFNLCGGSFVHSSFWLVGLLWKQYWFARLNTPLRKKKSVFFTETAFVREFYCDGKKKLANFLVH